MTSLRCGIPLLAGALAIGACAGTGRAPAPASPQSAGQLSELVPPALERMAERYLRVARQRDPASGIPRHTVAGGPARPGG
jgi:hypothetical protein